ncbi:kinase-like domain-containing protein [Lentinula raphanica]|nr:kinase-like domain-containing protein [Lentinula raphanica]
MGLLSFIFRLLGRFSNVPRRLFIKWLIRRSTKLPGGPAYRILDGTVVKIRATKNDSQREFEATEYARRHTNLPIPRIYDVFPSRDNQESYMVSEYIPGDMLQRRWRFLSDTQKHSLMSQVKAIVAELRSIRPPSPSPQQRIESFTGGPFYDAMIGGNDPCGPFENERVFNDFRISRYTSQAYAEVPIVRERLARIRREMPNDHDIVFTHGDISLRNILINAEGDGPDDEVKIVALLDWEQAGWRPAYWEKAKMLFIASPTTDWHAAVKSWIVEGYEKEWAREVELQLTHGASM